MTILDLKQAQAAILGVAIGDLTVNGLDLGLMAANAVRLQAEQLNDFEFQRQLVSVAVNTVTGGSLVNAVLYGTATTASIKTVIDVMQADVNGNASPVEWTTRMESLQRQYDERAPGLRPRWRTDADESYSVYTRVPRVTFAGDSIKCFPLAEGAGESLTLLLETYCYSPDWTTTADTAILTGGTSEIVSPTTFYRYGSYNGKPFFLTTVDGGEMGSYAIWHNETAWIISALSGIGTVPADYYSFTSTSLDPAGTYTDNGSFTGSPVLTTTYSNPASDIWLTKGFNYVLWASVVWLNQSDNNIIGKKFVPRTEGNLAPPQAMADMALQAFITNDTNKFETFRRHGR